MELWIRSQKGLVLKKINELMIEHKSGENIYFITDGRSCVLGEYETNERALEVLDEIQDIIKQQLMFHIDKSQCNTIEDIANPKFIIRDVGIPRVYEMPEE